jgi:RecB family endonuclease NucS
LKLRWLRWLDVGNGEVNKHETMKVIICQTLNCYITWGVTKSLSLRIYPPHKRISSQDTTCSSLMWITSKATEQLEFDNHRNDETQELDSGGEKMIFKRDETILSFSFVREFPVKKPGVKKMVYYICERIGVIKSW